MTCDSSSFRLATKRAATGHIRGPSFGSSTSRNCSRNRRTKRLSAAPGLGGCLAGADFLPAARALVGLQNLLAQADRLGRNLHKLVIGNEFDGLLQAQLAVRNQADGFVGAGRV